MPTSGQSVDLTIRQNAKMYRKRDTNSRLKLKIYQTTEEAVRGGMSGFSYCWVIAGFEGGEKAIISEDISKSMELLT